MRAMKTELAALFDKVHAEEALKARTLLSVRQRIQRGQAGKNRISARLAAVLAVFALMMTFCGCAFAVYLAPSAYIDLDVNPSVELVVNQFDRVIRASAYNAAGERALSSTRILHQTYKNAISTLLNAIMGDSSIDDYSLVAITVRTPNTSEETEMITELNTVVDTMLEAHHANASMDIFAVSDEIKLHASRCHMTPAKYLALQQLIAFDSSASFDECAAHSVGELRKYIKEQVHEHLCNHAQADIHQETHRCSGHWGEGSHCGHR